MVDDEAVDGGGRRGGPPLALPADVETEEPICSDGRGRFIAAAIVLRLVGGGAAAPEDDVNKAVRVVLLMMLVPGPISRLTIHAVSGRSLK